MKYNQTYGLFDSNLYSVKYCKNSIVLRSSAQPWPRERACQTNCWWRYSCRQPFFSYRWPEHKKLKKRKIIHNKISNRQRAYPVTKFQNRWWIEGLPACLLSLTFSNKWFSQRPRSIHCVMARKREEGSNKLPAQTLTQLTPCDIAQHTGSVQFRGLGGREQTEESDGKINYGRLRLGGCFQAESLYLALSSVAASSRTAQLCPGWSNNSRGSRLLRRQKVESWGLLSWTASPILRSS